MTLVLGVDGGNSKAIALVARADGTIVGTGRQLGSADIYAGLEAALTVTRGAVEAALAGAGVTGAAIDRAVFSMAGADWPEDIATLRRAFEREGFGKAVAVVNDGIGALTGAVPHGPAVVVSLGTGAATGARGPDGATWHSSFWQAPHGADELARTAVAAVARSELGIGPATPFRAELLRAAGADDVESLLHRITARAQPPATAVTAAIVRTLFAAAAAGDATAAEIVDRHGAGIGEVAAAAAGRVGADRKPYRLSFCGGLVRAGADRLVAAAVSAIERTGQRPVRVAPRWEPAVGALVIGLSTDAPGWEAVADRLDATLPAAELFDVR